MCAPLWSREEVIGVLYVDSPRSAQFGAADLDAFTALANAAAVAIEQARLSTQLLEETQAPRAAAALSLAGRRQPHHPRGRRRGSGPAAQERDVTVMFCDLVGFTTLCEQIPPAQAAALLNAFLTRMTDVVFEHEGTLDKFLGDALLAVFGAPFDQPQHPLTAVEAALAMRQALADMNAKQDGPKLGMRIAINTGVALTGDIGSPKRREFTVLGDVVNTASRIEDEVAGPGEIVISGATYERVKDQRQGPAARLARRCAAAPPRSRSTPSKADARTVATDDSSESIDKLFPPSLDCDFFVGRPRDVEWLGRTSASTACWTALAAAAWARCTGRWTKRSIAKSRSRFSTPS